MTPEASPTVLARLARRPFPVLLGAAAGFLCCCLGGRLAARQQPIQGFVRFHQAITPEFRYYPTYSQTLNLARQHARPGKTLVVLGGNSVINGVGQRAGHVWSAHLQELLGDDYVVLNLGMRGGVENEIGALIADRLTAEGVRLVFVCMGVGWPADWDGVLYRYFFWDAWGKGQLPPDPGRDRWLAEEFGARYGGDEKRLELRRGGRVDGVAYANDLWNLFAYRCRATVWTPLGQSKFWHPYRLSADNEPGPAIPFEVGNNPKLLELQVRPFVRKVLNSEEGKALAAGQYETVGSSFKGTMPRRLDDRSLHIVRPVGTYYLTRLEPGERADYEEYCRRLRDALVRVGLQAQLVGQGYAETDYCDAAHFTESGGRKFAEELAPTIRAMNHRLYGVKGEKP